MTDEDFFQEALDADEDSAAARLLFAEWLAERGDERAAGCLWLAERAARPLRTFPDDDRVYRWISADYYRAPRYRDIGYSGLPAEMMMGLEQFQYRHLQCWVEYPTRRSAEEAICRFVEARR